MTLEVARRPSIWRRGVSFFTRLVLKRRSLRHAGSPWPGARPTEMGMVGAVLRASWRPGACPTEMGMVGAALRASWRPGARPTKMGMVGAALRASWRPGVPRASALGEHG